MTFQKRIIALFLAVMIVVSIIPSAYAADDDSVLTSIGNSSTDTVTLSGSERDVTLTVPFSYSAATVDLSNGLIITCDDTLYKSVVAVPASVAVVGGDAVDLTVTYNYFVEDDSAAKSKTIYKLKVKKAEMTPAEYSGVIERSIKYPSTVSISFAEDEFTSLYTQNDGEELGYITISGSNLVVGTLMYDGSNYTFDSSIDTFDINKLSFNAASYGTVSYDVKAYGAATNLLVGTAVLTITVYQVPEIESAITKSTYIGATLDFSATDFKNCCDMFGMPIDSVEITPAETVCGTWYLGTNKILTTTTIPASKIGNLSFVGTAAGTAGFEWRVSNIAGFSDFGLGSISVSAPTIKLSSYTSSSSLTKGNVWTVATAHFGYSPSSAALKYIKIITIPAAADGTIMLTTALAKNDTYGYPAIAANKVISAGAVIPYNYIQYLRISTKSTSTNSSVAFTWTATADSTISSATWADTVSYSVKFVSGGSVSYDTYTNVPVAFNASDFSTSFSNASGYSLSYITFSLPAKTSGTLYFNYSRYSKTGTGVTASTKYYTGTSPNLSYLTFVPATDYTGTVTIPYSAYNSSGTYFAGTLTINVSNSVGGTIVYTIDKNSDVQLDAADISEAFLNATGKTLSYVKFTLPSSTYGKLYYDYVSASNYDSTVSATKKYYVYSSPYVSYVSFVPYDDYTGNAVVSYTGYDENGKGYSGKLIVIVIDSPAGIVNYSSKVNGITQISGDDLSDEFISITGSVLSYVQFVPPAKTSGVLYYDYSSETAKGTAVAAATKYYNGSSPDISDICFVPAKDYAGEVEIKYTVYTSNGTFYTGKLKINVGEASSGAVYYETDLNTEFKLSSSELVSKYYANTGGSILSYVTFTLPATSCGKLYYNYTSATSYGSPITAGTKYYVGSSPYLSNISFVPKTGYSGSFTITYTGYSADGTGYSGKIYVTVDSGEGIVSYTTSCLEPVTFSVTYFKSAFYDDTGNTLSYVKFSIPSASRGTLYYGYTSSTSYTSSVSSTTKYYVSSSPSLSRITFVPNSSYSGVVSIDYTAYDTDGDKYGGTVEITVEDSDGGTVNYQTVMNSAITLDPDDFNSAFLDDTGYSLSYIKFTLPDASCGQLYYGYVSSSQLTSKVSASTKYYRSVSPLLSNITFVPYQDYTGTVNINYNGYTSSGDSYTGVLVIEVKQPFSDMSSRYSWADSAVSYLYNNDIVKGTGDGMFNPGDNMSRGDFMLMVYRAFDLSETGPDNFSDVSYGSYYYDAISAAKELGIAYGSSGKFYPESDISRQDAMVIIVRTLEILGESLKAGTASDLADYSDADDVSSYAVESVAMLVKAGIISGSGGVLNPKEMINRAEMAVLLYRVLL